MNYAETYTFKNGDTYKGEWKNNNIDGKGKSDVLANSKNTVSQSNTAEQNKIQEVPKIETADDVPQIPQVEILTPIPC
ncbi:hypothetical protein [Clostridium autoethanogenum]|uniref:MORN repeat-containing protein n=1 Tax=Clostridium autoethanogenum DSM 10061 TaxID=1341692 RepID=A0ABM5NYS6_9CLOT|nr:hypothetical protein [Clostridium autoethanogenum]AGY77792.1 hypothetical protein CAETHG_3589 [Clostridium autoethanogenum DSM 10061]ALU37927.1 hypothetical protein CLAU_3500 [Clostridium autoethanogenum DSM 10061]OVY49722.1 hypothetical protein WX72_03101 [Clostridium autoethanogenum]